MAGQLAEHGRIAAGDTHRDQARLEGTDRVSGNADSGARRQRPGLRWRTGSTGDFPVKRARGIALLFALWALALLAALLAGLALGARSESEAARHLYSQVQARYAAEAGVARAVAALRDSNPANRWVPDGRMYRFEYNGARVEVRIDDVSGQVDLNAATPDVLTNLFLAAGTSHAQARALSDAVQDWRDSDDIPHAYGAEADAYKRAGMKWLPRNGPFRTPDELSRVYGMSDALYRKVADAVTVYSGRNFPDPQYAGALALAAGRDGDLAEATRLVAARRAQAPAALGATPMRAAGVSMQQPPVAGFGGITQEIRSLATMPDGTQSGQDAIVRLVAIGGISRPYTVLGWRSFSEEPPEAAPNLP
ncbi:MAG: general secretion pathway protein GspK [Proteobacteria bacterium]|nr:general secretion pathway protein GspK [Pseudomonadota bacterium]